MEEKIIWHNISWKKATELLNSNYEKGLIEEEIKFRHEDFGKNILPKEKPIPRFNIFLEQFKSPLIYILIGAGIITIILGEYTDAFVIFAAVILNSLLGFFQEDKASRALRGLKNVLAPKAIVLRNGKKEEIFSSEIVPGDIIFLKSGDKVPVDARLIDSNNLKVDESVLTGEYLPCLKITGTLPKETPLADRDNMVYMGTIIEDGKGLAIVTNTGTNTEIGKITSLVKETKEEKTPYQKRVSSFSKTIGIIMVIICIAIFIEGMLTGAKFVEMFTTAVAVAVAIIPEGLPVTITVILALGMQRIFKRKGLVRKLIAVETLGSTSIIATDKTGTLTEGRMKVVGVFTPFSKEQEKSMVYKTIVLCSEAFIENPEDKPKNWKIRGMSTEKALILAGAKAGFLKNNSEEVLISEIPFSSEYKYSASLRKKSQKENILYVKGAPEIILEKSKYLMFNNKKIKINKNNRESFNKEYENLTSKGYRVLGVGYKKQKETFLGQEINDLIFAGFVFLEDPVRKKAKKAIQTCYQAGMRPIIITGDHKLTAKAVVRKIGFNVEDKNILEGKDLEKMSDSEFDKIINNIQIYARVEPKHKLRIVKAWQEKGEVVAMTGDGINDAPALKQADIGIGLGSGTEVAKEVADIVLLTDDFSVIVAAVEEGRAIIDNIRKVITYLLSDSFTEVILIGVSIFAGFPLPITAAQILWINLMEDGLPDVALAFEPKEKDLMKQKPRNRNNNPLLTKEMKIIIFIIGLITDLILLGIFMWLLKQDYNIEYIRTIIFACLAMDSISYIFSCKSLRKNIWHIDIFNNKLLIVSWFLGLIGLFSALYVPFLNNLLGTIPLPFSSWPLIISLAVINTALIESVKYYFIKKDKLKNDY